jgi:predicted  nucleic acid-binding Zn-ribbon protein
MLSDVEALLSLQQEDSRIRELEDQLRGLDPRLAELDRRREAASAALNRARSAVDAEERRQRELSGKLSDHKQVQERNLAQLDAVKRLREATAAMAQVEASRRIIAEEESELQAIARRLTELRASVNTHETSLEEIELEQAAARGDIEAERGTIETTLGQARAERDAKTANVSRPLLGKYDRIRSRRKKALYPLRGNSCGNCDTAIPMQRRNQMSSSSGAIEVCEACGVLLYRAESA